MDFLLKAKTLHGALKIIQNDFHIRSQWANPSVIRFLPDLWHLALDGQSSVSPRSSSRGKVAGLSL